MNPIIVRALTSWQPSNSRMSNHSTPVTKGETPCRRHFRYRTETCDHTLDSSSRTRQQHRCKSLHSSTHPKTLVGGIPFHLADGIFLAKHRPNCEINSEIVRTHRRDSVRCQNPMTSATKTAVFHHKMNPSTRSLR